MVVQSNGAVICFQKYTLGGDINRSSINSLDSPVCFGYFGRVDVQRVQNFKEYVRIASRHGADQACSRKQLLTYRIDKKFDKEIEIASNEQRQCGGLPFCDSLGEQSLLCCCTALNVSSGMMSKENGVFESAQLIFNKLNTLVNDKRFHFAITGLWGAEDLCIIMLANQYNSISEAISTVQQLKSTDDDCYVIDNSHSILMMDTTGNVVTNQNCWDNTHAEIHFSLKSIAGQSYLLKVKDKIAALVSAPELVKLEARSGEYDAVIRCPATVLGKELYGSGGVISYGNEEYLRNVYQSETIIYPFGYSGMNSSSISNHPISCEPDVLFNKVKEAVEEIRVCFLGDKNATNSDFDYIELAIFRLLKDYRRFIAFPYCKILHEDYEEQFLAAINAIVFVAKQCVDPDIPIDIAIFNNAFDEIVNALSESMQTAGQLDRLTFAEQPSHLQNIGSYHKILRCYYGIIKDILKLLYSIGREQDHNQPVLIPILSFGLTPIIVSRSYDSVYEKAGTTKPAKFISIKLPYQALTNPAKYLGILVHEIFHYAVPSNRATRNRLVTKCLASVALSEFLSLLAKGHSFGTPKDFGGCFYKNNKPAFDMAIDQICRNLIQNDNLIEIAKFDQLADILQTSFALDLHVVPQLYEQYYGIWCNLRSQLLLSPDSYTEDERALFLLAEADDKDDTCLRADFSKITESISFEDIRSFNHILSDVMHALGELPPDLFDVGFVLHDSEPQRKIGQFLWQLYGTQRDFTSGSILSADQAEKDLITDYLGQASIRIGFFIDYHLRELGVKNGEGVLLKNLGQWGADIEKFQNVKTQFIHDYATYLEYSSPFTVPVMELCDMVEGEIFTLNSIPECKKIIEKLNAFYRRYYLALDSLQKGDLSPNEFDDDFFNLAKELIEAYQQQDSIRSITEKSQDQIGSVVVYASQLPTHNSTRTKENDFSSVATSSAELSRAIGAGYSAMKPANVMPVLWYRGQRVLGRDSLPNIMRGTVESLEGENTSKTHFFHTLSEEIRWARANILPVGKEFSQAEWLAFLQHNSFKTNILDFSESLFPALYFATEKWSKRIIPKEDAVVSMFNPVLFNLAMDSIEKNKITQELEYYLKNGTQKNGDRIEPPLFATEESVDSYNCYFDWSKSFDPLHEIKYPRAALVPKNSERMKIQSGQFVFFDMQCNRQIDQNGKYSYSVWSLEQLHVKYEKLFSEEQMEWFRPFMFNIIISHTCYQDFKEYLQAIGMMSYQVYPEYDKLANDIKKKLGIEI